jgi:hypothetical protein
MGRHVRRQDRLRHGEQPKDTCNRDLNGDGTRDLMVASYAGPISVLLGAGDGTFGAMPRDGTPYGSELAAADLDGDGRLDSWWGARRRRRGFGPARQR